MLTEEYDIVYNDTMKLWDSLVALDDIVTKNTTDIIDIEL